MWPYWRHKVLRSFPPWKWPRKVSKIPTLKPPLDREKIRCKLLISADFKETLPLVEKSIQEADFLVIDAEFTGLINGPDVSIFDPPEQYYTTLLQGSTEFLLVQFGLSAFRWDEKTSQYMNDSYNFYVFPRGRPGPEKIFLCQSSSLDFLASQGFDFNKVIRDG